jgi:hypothetical protein
MKFRPVVSEICVDKFMVHGKKGEERGEEEE